VLSVFDGQVGDPEITVATYVSTFAAQVRVIDLEQAVPGVFG
jgi:hypothetical protein